MKKSHKVGEFNVIVTEAKVGEVIDLMGEYLKMNNLSLEKLDIKKLVENGSALFEIGTLIKSLPMVEQLINSLVTITDQDGTTRSYRDLAISEVVVVLGHLKEVNSYFLEMLGVITAPENQ